MDLKNFVALFLVITFILHGIAFTLLGFKRRKGYYFLLTGTFAFLTAIYLIKFEGRFLSVPGTSLPATSLLRISATLCTMIYLRCIYREEGSWLWKLTRRRKDQ